MTRILAGIVTFIGLMPIFGFTACGGGTMRPPDPVPTDVIGSWTGDFSFSLGSDEPRTYHASIQTKSTLEPRIASVTGLCPDGTGEIQVFGFDPTYRWDGTLQCEQPTYLRGCPFIYITYSGAEIVTNGDTITIRAVGRAVSDICPMDERVSLIFLGTKDAESAPAVQP
jgi:hypothetical protein